VLIQEDDTCITFHVTYLLFLFVFAGAVKSLITATWKCH
jgi:hypothetical protein